MGFAAMMLLGLEEQGIASAVRRIPGGFCRTLLTLAGNIGGYADGHIALQGGHYS